MAEFWASSANSRAVMRANRGRDTRREKALTRGIENSRQCCHPGLALLPEGGTFHEATGAEHHEILAAVEAEAAERAMKVHVERSMWSVQKLLTALAKRRRPDEP